MTSCAWLWMYAGAALMLMELLAPGFVIFFFGLSAATVGLCLFALGEAFTPTWQFIAFSVFSVLYLAFIRRWLKSIFTGASSVSGGIESDFAGRIAKVTEAIEPPAPGRVMLGDSGWEAVADTAIPCGAEVRIVAQRNLTLKVEPV